MPHKSNSEKLESCETKGQHLLYFLAEAIPSVIYIIFYDWANSRGRYADGSFNFMIKHMDGHIPSPLIMFTCTGLPHALLE
jgi:hypothetical protein